MKIQYQPMQTVTKNDKNYTVSLMNIDYQGLPNNGQRYALVKTEGGQYFVAEWSDSSWAGNDVDGWRHVATPSISLIGTGKQSGKEAVKWFVETMKSNLSQKMACR